MAPPPDLNRGNWSAKFQGLAPLPPDPLLATPLGYLTWLVFIAFHIWDSGMQEIIWAILWMLEAKCFRSVSI